MIPHRVAAMPSARQQAELLRTLTRPSDILLEPSKMPERQNITWQATCRPEQMDLFGLLSLWDGERDEVGNLVYRVVQGGHGQQSDRVTLADEQDTSE